VENGGGRNSDVAAAACCCRCPAWQADHYGTPQALVPSLMVECQAQQPHAELDWAATSVDHQPAVLATAGER